MGAAFIDPLIAVYLVTWLIFVIMFFAPMENEFMITGLSLPIHVVCKYYIANIIVRFTGKHVNSSANVTGSYMNYLLH